MGKTMQGLLIFPPQWYPGNPYPAVPLLLGQLKRVEYSAVGLDINIDFYNYILTKKYLESSVKRANEIVDLLNEDLKNTSKDNLDKLPENIKKKINKLSIINKYRTKHSAKLVRIPREIEFAVNVLKTPDLFYNPELLFKAKSVIFDALKIVSLPFAPAELSFANYYNPAAMAGYDELKAECFNTDSNMFIEYFENKVDSILAEDAAYIVISIADMTQLIPAFTLGRMLKEKCNKPICIGGSIVTKLLETFSNHGEILDTFCDFLSYGDGENSIVAFAGYIEGGVEINDVPGLVYKDTSGNICVNRSTACTDLNDIADVSFDGFLLDKYFSPEPVFSVQLSKGCYWGKCAFCDVSYSRKQYNIKSPERAVEELKTLKERYDIKNFLLSDDSVSPECYSKFSKLLIESGIKINLFSMARLESGFTKEVLHDMQRAGCKMVFWGYESKSERVMALINKGINIKNRLDILSDSKEKGIWNHVAFMIGFPTETESEAEETIKAIHSAGDIIDSCYLSKFSFKKNAAISDCPGKYGISSYEAAGEFQLDYKYQAPGMPESEKKRIGNTFRSQYLSENINRLWPMLCLDFEYLLLYLSHYGRDWVRDYRLKTLPDSIDGFIAYL